MMKLFPLLLFGVLLTPLLAAEPPPTRESVNAATLRAYDGPSVRGVDVSTLTGKTMCGYQGWFNAEGDGMGLGYRHWAKTKALGPDTVKVDLWPDMNEYGADERFATVFKHADGRAAEVFSSARRETVLRHFQWMRDYGIDGAFVQRFASETRSPAFLRHINTLLAHAREGANRNGRAYVVMYDLSGLGAGSASEVIEDWRELRTRMRVTEDAAYQHHEGKPLVAVWGVGFFDEKRAYSLDDCRQIVDALKQDGCAVMLGIPTQWRTAKAGDAQQAEFLELCARVDVLSPWAVGRIRTPEEAAKQGEKLWKPDLAWCEERGVDFLPVLFPGFSWHNMHGGPLDQIPRRKGEFLWSQFQAAERAEVKMAYVAMFDEVDEGTAIFKCTSDVPLGEPAKFLTLDGLPNDHYLRLVGKGARMIRREIPATEQP